MKLDRYVAFDTETSGLGEDARIVEITLALFESRNDAPPAPVDTWSQLLWPGDIAWDDAGVKRALEVNHLTREDLFDKPTFQLIFPELCQRFAAAPVWVAHNTEFDMRMLRQERLRLPGETAKLVPRPEAVLDTMLLDLVLNEGYLKRRLDCVAPRWGVTLDGAHRAAADAVCCGQILSAMLPKLPETMDELRELQGGARKTWTGVCSRAKAREERAKKAERIDV
jgi:DNA polymerase III epsilon subunit-like protein